MRIRSISPIACENTKFMTKNPMQIWTNVKYEEPAIEMLREWLKQRRCNLNMNTSDETGIAFGQPPLDLISGTPTIRWIHLDSAGYDRYDSSEFREMAAGRGLIVTNSSSVYDEPCAQHAAAMILSLARRLPQSYESQMRDQSWPMMRLRAESRLLNDQNIVLLGFGAIARRLVELLEPFEVRISAVRRSSTGEESIAIFPHSELKARFAEADHIVNLLPANETTRGFINDSLLKYVKPGANFYNIGRGSTVDHDALLRTLESGRLAAAYLDVTDPEPLPLGHPLWKTPNCYITPHTAGGHTDERPRLINHFLLNLDRFVAGDDLIDRII